MSLTDLLVPVEFTHHYFKHCPPVHISNVIRNVTLRLPWRREQMIILIPNKNYETMSPLIHQDLISWITRKRRRGVSVTLNSESSSKNCWSGKGELGSFYSWSVPKLAKAESNSCSQRWLVWSILKAM